MLDIHEKIMQRCLQLATMGIGQVAPNPMVGAVLLHDGIVIGEGYHQKYGEAHAEVNCVNSVPEDKKQLIAASTMYVSLEPCSHYGKTPPCTALIITQRIPCVVIGCIDPFAAVSGKGIAQLREAGVEVVSDVCEADCKDLNKRFLTFHEKRRPYIILKWAQSADGFMALPGPKPVQISNAFTSRLTHRWRSEEAGILVGADTALLDNPQLTNRLWTGKSPVRIVLDRNLRLPGHLNIFNNDIPTLIFNSIKSAKKLNTEWISIPSSPTFLNEVLSALYDRNILSVMVEGGAEILHSFIEAGLWDEARVITGRDLLGAGLRAPQLKDFFLVGTDEVGGDQIRFFGKNR